jgi:hypothetical protein
LAARFSCWRETSIGSPPTSPFSDVWARIRHPRACTLAFMSVLRRRAWPWFALVVVLSVLGLFFLDGANAGVVLLAAMLIFIAACIRALAGHDRPPDDRAGLGGWFSRGL